MELNVATKPRQTLLRALRALLPALQEKLGDPAGFRDVAAPILLRESENAVSELKEADALADQVHRAVTRLRAIHFRRLDTQQALDASLKALEPSLNSLKANPVLAAGLWLAHRVHGAGLMFLDSKEGQKALATAKRSSAIRLSPGCARSAARISRQRWTGSSRCWRTGSRPRSGPT